MSTHHVRSAAYLTALFLTMATGTARGQYFLDDFEDGDFLNGDPVLWAIGNGRFEIEHGDLVVFNTGNAGAFATVGEHLFSDQSSVRALVGFRDLDPNPTEADVFVILHGGPDATGYLGELWWDGRLVIGRAPGDGSCCNVMAETRLQDFDAVNPSTRWWIELEYRAGTLSLRAWDESESRPTEPQVVAVDPNPFSNGIPGLGFRRLPASGTSKGVFRQFEAGAELPPPSAPPAVRDAFSDGDLADCEPVCWEIGNPNATYDASSGDLVIFNHGNSGAFMTTPTVLEDHASARALVGFRDLDPNPREADVFVILQGGENTTGYLGELWWNGRIVIGRAPGGGSCCDVKDEGLLLDFAPDADTWLELSYRDAQLELRAWPWGTPRPAQPQLSWTDPAPYTSGVPGLGFRRLPAGGTSKGIFRYFEAGVKLGPVDSIQPPSNFLRGDCNDDGNVDISDAVLTLDSLFLGLGEGDPACDDACDSNDDGAVDISDAINTLSVLFVGNGVIPLPGMDDCGVDPTEDEVGCGQYRGCS